MKKHFLFQFIFVLALSLMFSGCNRTGKQNKGTTADGKEASVEVETFDAVKIKDQIVEVIRNSPQAVEVVDLLNKAGASYIFDLTVPVENAEKLMTATEKSLGLGMYQFDGKYASVYNRSDVNLQLLDNTNLLIGQLGIQDELSFAGTYTERIRKNQTNKDSVDMLTTQALNDYYQYMETSDHADIYALSVIGANVEALYVLSQMTLLAKDKAALLEVMKNQNDRVKSLGSLLELMSGDETVKPWFDDFKPVLQFFENRTTLSVDDLNVVAPMIAKVRNSMVRHS